MMTEERYDWVRGLFERKDFLLAELCESGELIDVLKECIDDMRHCRKVMAGLNDAASGFRNERDVLRTFSESRQREIEQHRHVIAKLAENRMDAMPVEIVCKGKLVGVMDTKGDWMCPYIPDVGKEYAASKRPEQPKLHYVTEGEDPRKKEKEARSAGNENG